MNRLRKLAGYRPAARSMHRTAFAMAVAIAVTGSMVMSPQMTRSAQAADDAVIATVDGVEIKQSLYDLAKEVLGPQLQNAPDDQVKKVLTGFLVDAQLIANAARDKGLDKTDAYKTRLHWLKLQALRDVYVEQEVYKSITDEAVKSRYDEMVANLPPVLEIRARHILVKTEDEAKEIITELQGGADFAELAKAKSTGPSGPNGGDLGYFQRGQMVPAFDKAAADMKPGEHSKEPVKTQFGWHVIKVEDQRKQPPPSFEQAAPRIRSQLQQTSIKTSLEALRADAKIDQKAE